MSYGNFGVVLGCLTVRERANPSSQTPNPNPKTLKPQTPKLQTHLGFAVGSCLEVGGHRSGAGRFRAEG